MPEMPRTQHSRAWFAAVIGGCLAIVLFAAGAWLAFAGFREVRANIVVDEQVRTTELAAVTLLCVMADAETGQRGYLLTGDPAYLAPYRAARSRVSGSLAALNRAPFAGSEQVELAQLRRLTKEKMAELAQTLALAQSGQHQAAIELVHTDQGQRLMDAIRRNIGTIREAAKRHMMAQRLRNHVQTKWVTVAGLTGLGLLLLGSALFARRMAHRAAAASEAAKQTFASAFDLAPGMMRDPTGVITFWSRGAEQLYGFSAAEAVGHINHDLLRTKFPVPLEVIEAELWSRGSWQGELVRHRRDGTMITVISHWSLHRGQNHSASAIIEVNNDITARRRDEQRLRLLVHELNHRVKNTLSIVQALAARSFAKADRALRNAFEARLLTLAAAHDVLTEEGWEGGSLSDLVAKVLAPFGVRDDTRFRVTGSALWLRPQAALTLAMVLNELATNAIKYGALSAGAAGYVMIDWRVEDHRLRLVWSERNGPAVVAPSHAGFGTVLIERGLAGEFGARVSLAFPPEGVVCTIDACMDNLVAEAVSLPEVGAREHEVT